MKRRLSLAIVLVALALGCGPVSSQVPAPLPLRDVTFPDFDERILSNGARLIVVPQREVPFVTVNVVVPAGTVADPEGKEGTATFVAQLLTSGTTSRGFVDLSQTLDRHGISLAAEAQEEWSTVSLNTTTAALDEGLDVLVDVLMHPSFPDDRFEGTRRQGLTGLQVQSSRPDAVADRAFARAIYGSHPYGRMPTPPSVRALTRDDLVAFHDLWYRPDGALIVVAGDVVADDIAERIDSALHAWGPARRPEVTFERAPDRTGVEILVVHQPGTVQAEIRVGHLLAGAETEGWERLVVANQLLGGGPPGRLQQVLRNARGYTYDARSTITRLRRLGVFRIETAARNEVAADAVEEILSQVQRLRARAIPQGELDDTKSYLVGSFPLSIETPQQVAGQVTTHRLLGLGTQELESYRTRVAAVDTADARDAAERWIRPEQFVVVVAGDAGVLQPRLRGLGEVQIVDVDGRPLRLADLAPQPSSEVFDLSGLEPAQLTYDVQIGGLKRGEARRTLERMADGWRFASVIEAGPQRLEQEIVVDSALGLVSSRNHTVAGGRETLVTTRLEGDRLVGRNVSGTAGEDIDLAVPGGVTLSDGIELALWCSELSVGREIRLPVANLRTGAVDEVVMRVEEETDLTIPSGTYRVFRVSVAGPEAQTLYVLATAPHIPVRLESASQPVALELSAIGGR